VSTPIYELRSLTRAYAGRTILQIDELAIEPASIVGLIGPNGSGKSTLLKLLGLIERPTHGSILFDGKPAEPFSNEARFAITLLPQEPFLMKRSVFNNVAYGLRLRGADGDVAERVDHALALVGLDSGDFARRHWYALSGGEAQRVALAARLALRPKVLLMDEPTASVDAGSAQLIKEASMRARRELGTTLIVASHDWQWLYEICDRILHLFRGRIFGTGRETINFGPWEQLGAGSWGKQLPDRQQVRVPPPPDREAAAVIEVVSLGGEGAGIVGEGDYVDLQGTVSRLSLEKKSGAVFATVLVGDLPFSVRLTPEQSRERALFPGKSARIRYRVDRVRWV
jgi:tungstate transport system ATP-binding protein